MKHCPTCQRTFEDDSLSYCLDDGTPLAAENSRRPDSDETLVTPTPTPSPGESGARRELPPTQYAQLPGKATVSASGVEIPPMPPYRTTPEKRRVWPWVVAGLVGLFLIGIVIAAVITIPMMVQNSSNQNRIITTDSPPASSPELSTPKPDSSPSENAAPTDEDTVLEQLTEIEKQWTEANVKGDKDAIERILAEEYSGGDPPHTKKEYIENLTHDPEVNSWELQDLKVDLEGNKARLSGYLRQETTRGTEVYSFTDGFIWREGRWQAVASQASRVK